MSILNNVTSFFQPKPIPIPHEDCKPARPDDCGDGKESRWNDDHKGRDHWKNGDKDGHSKHGKNDDDHKGRDHWKDGDKDGDSKHGGKDHGKDGHSKHAKNDDCSDDGRKDGDWKYGGKDDHKDGKGDHPKHDGGWKDAKNDDCRPHKDYCEPPKDHCPPKDCQSQKDYCAPRPSDDCGNGNGNGNGHANGSGDTYHSPGDALARFDFSRGDFGSHGSDHSGDIQGALASMSSDHALDYAIGQMGPADHFDIGQDDVTSHEGVQHA
jgi:hypothetical protein